jgi:hypothetical protein
MPPSIVMSNRDNRLNISAGGTCQFVDLKQALDYSQTEARRELVIMIQLSSLTSFIGITTSDRLQCVPPQTLSGYVWPLISLTLFR